MAPKDVARLFEVWKVDEHVAFKYYEYLLDEEIITIKRISKTNFELVPEKSSINNAGPWHIMDLEKILGRDGLKTKQLGVHGEYWKLSNGCVCGQWRTSEPDCHAYWCTKYRKY